MENPKINIDDYYPPKETDRYPRRAQAQETRNKRDKIALVLGVGAIPIAALIGSALNSDPVEDSPKNSEQSTVVDQNQEVAELKESVVPGSIRTVNFEQQQDGSYSLKDSE